MTTNKRGGALRKTVLTALAAAVALPFGALTATAAPSGPGSVTSNPEYVKPGPGYDGVIDGRSAGTDIIKFGKNGKLLDIFCIQYGVPAATSGTYTPISWSSSKIKNLGKVAGIASNSAGIGKPLADEKAEAVAAQLAIWYYTDGVDVTTVPNPTIVKRAQEIINGAHTAVEHPTPVTDIKVTIDAVETPEGTTDFTLYFTDGKGNPAPKVSYTLALDGETSKHKTDAAGETRLELKGNFAGKTAKITPEIAFPAGTVLDPGNGKQIMIVAHAAEFKDIMGDINLEVKVTPLPTPDEPVTETPVKEVPVVPGKPKDTTPPPAEPVKKDTPVKKETPKKEETVAAPVTPEKPEELPHTGTWVTPALFAGLLLLAGAGGFTYWKLRPENQ